MKRSKRFALVIAKPKVAEENGRKAQRDVR